ncbi:calmodulin CALM [Acrasis kona]|uniref:Calmodulin CALM n=1 Tax=Acrasis kona TaxID=1008807 RepID=A0AAW2Z2Y2_9EUKA
MDGLKFFFTRYDRDCDGYLSLSELRDFLDDNLFECQIGSEHAERIMTENDVDLDRKLDFDDFSFLLYAEKKTINLFYDCDENHDGFVDLEELKTGFQKLGEDYEDDIIEEIIYESDRDGDGKLNYPEFRSMLNSI